MENKIVAKMDYSSSMPEAGDDGRATLSDQIHMAYDHSPEMAEFVKDFEEKMAEGEPEQVGMVYAESEQMYEGAGGKTPVTIPIFGSEGESKVVYLKDAVTFAIDQIQKSFDSGMSDEIVDHWVKICSESNVLDPALLPTIKKLAEQGKAVMNEGELEAFINALKTFRRDGVRISKSK